jgi:hypothetical protein
MFFGDAKTLMVWLILALGGALFAGNILAIVKPPPAPKDGDHPRAPLSRSIFMGALGLIAAIWALATLLS